MTGAGSGNSPLFFRHKLETGTLVLCCIIYHHKEWLGQNRPRQSRLDLPRGLLSYPEATIYNFDTIPITETRYEDTDYYKIYKDFLTDRGKYLWS